MFGLVAALIGVGLATVGVFLFISNRFIGNRGLGGELFSIALLLGGGAILLSSVTLNYNDDAQVAGFDPNRLLDEQPTAAGGPAQGGIAATPTAIRALLPHQKIAVLAWGTPSDMDTADTAQIEAYSVKLQHLAHALLKDQSTDAQISTHTLTREDHQKLSALPLVSTGWCERYQTDLLVAVGMGTVMVGNGDYALWREPVYEALDCHTERASRRIGKINERPGDRFPYQQAVRADLAELLDGFAATQPGQ